MRKPNNKVQIGLFFQFGAISSTSLDCADRDWSSEFSTFDRVYKAIESADRRLPSRVAEIADGPM